MSCLCLSILGHVVWRIMSETAFSAMFRLSIYDIKVSALTEIFSAPVTSECGIADELPLQSRIENAQWSFTTGRRQFHSQ